MNHTRHMGIYQIPRTFSVGLVGAGGIGAMTALMLAKMGVQLLDVWDDDVVSAENIPTQLHRVSDIGELKVHGLGETLRAFTDSLSLFTHTERIMPSSDLGQWGPFDLFITAVDSIQARHDIWNAVHGSVKIRWFLDARMGAEKFDMFVVDMGDQGAAARYEQLLFSITDADVPDAPCTEKATFFCSAHAAGHIGTAVRNIVRGEARSRRVVHNIPHNSLMEFNI